MVLVVFSLFSDRQAYKAPAALNQDHTGLDYSVLLFSSHTMYIVNNVNKFWFTCKDNSLRIRCSFLPLKKYCVKSCILNFGFIHIKVLYKFCVVVDGKINFDPKVAGYLSKNNYSPPFKL